MRSIVPLTLIAIALCTAPARADRIHLADGAVLEGKATRQGDKVVIALDSGEITLPADEVEKIEKGESNVSHFEDEYGKLAAGDIKARLSLANFCRDHDMRDRERQLLQEVINLSPDHAEARARLGFVHTDAGWIKREEQLRAQGYVLHEGQWITQAQLLELERMQAQTETAARQRDKAQAELDAKRMEVAERQIDVERARAKRDAEDQARAQAAMQPPSIFSYSPYGYGGYWPSPYARPAVYAPPVQRARVVHNAFPIPGVQDPWVYIRDPNGYPRP